MSSNWALPGHAWGEKGGGHGIFLYPVIYLSLDLDWGSRSGPHFLSYGVACFCTAFDGGGGG